MAFKQGAGVLEVLFGVGFGGGDAVEGFVEDGDDAVLFGERGITESAVKLLQSSSVFNSLHHSAPYAIGQ